MKNVTVKFLSVNVLSLISLGIIPRVELLGHGNSTYNRFENVFQNSCTILHSLFNNY